MNDMLLNLISSFLYLLYLSRLAYKEEGENMAVTAYHNLILGINSPSQLSNKATPIATPKTNC